MTAQWIVSSCVLILVVLLLRILLGRHISARLQYALWAVVLIRLLAPPAWLSLTVTVPKPPAWAPPESMREESIYLLPLQSAPVEGMEHDVLLSESGEILDANSFGYARLENGGRTVTRYADRISPLQLLRLIWGAGAVILGTLLLLSNLGFARRLHRSRRRLEDTAAPLPVYRSAGLPSPCLFGLLRPAVYVTEEAAQDPVMLRHVLAHELTHYRHRDHLWSVLRGAALAIHWWNPLVWLAVSLSRRDGELACDEGALERLGEGERRAYGETLLKLVTARARSKDLLSFATTMTDEKRNLRERIRRIVCQPKQLVSAMAAIAAVLTLTVLVTFSQAEAVQGAAGGASAPEAEAGDKDAWRDAQITLDERGIPHIRYPYDNGVRELEGKPIPAPREWADEDLAGRGEASALEFSPEIWGRLVSPTDGWLVASYDRGAGVTDTYIYKTSDGGMNWTEVTAPGLDHAIADVGFVSPNRLIVAQKLFVGAPVYLTKDGGLSWELINLPWTDAEVDSIYVSGGSVQMVLFGDGSSTWTMTSDDFGDTWTSWDNAALDLLLSEMTAEDIGEETSADAKEMARALREASPHRWSRLYTGEGNFDQTSAWVWCDVVEALPLKAGGTLYMAASYRNETDLMIGWETEAGIRYAIYASPELHALVSRLGRTYPAETLPHTPDLNHDGEPDQIFLCRARPDSTDLCLRFPMETEDGRETWEETASTAHAGWIGLFLVQRDGEDCLLRYTPYSGGGACAYRYQLFYLQDDGAELVQENSVDFDFNFDREGSHQFDPRAIAGFMTEINSLLARSTPLLITDPNLAATFEREGRLYDSLGWLEEDGFTRGVGTTLLQDLLAYRNWRLEQGAIPSLDAVFSEIRAEDISSTGRAGVSARELAPILNSGARSQAADGRGFPDEASWTMAVTYVREGDLEEQKLLLEGSELPDIIRVTLSGQATAVQYSENPSVDGMYLHDVPYSRTVYIQNESLYQLLAGID